MADWFDLPNDIVRFILEKLVWADRYSMCLSCKNWLECLHETANTQEFLPWLMAYRWDRTGDGGGDSICKLYDPAAQRSYIVKEAAILKNRDLRDASPRHSRNGWVLFSKALPNSWCLFFYGPFCNEVIKLPILENECYRHVTFSLSPNSPDCTVIAWAYPRAGKIEIQTCHPRDESWKAFEFQNDYKRFTTLEVAHVGESFYCSFSGGKMAVFNTRQQEWKVFPELSPVAKHRYLSTAFNGDLLLSRSYNELSFWRFDVSKTKWVFEEDESFKKQVIFQDNTPYSMSVPAMGNAKESAGKIYFVDDEYAALSYFYHTKMAATSDEYKWIEEEEEEEELQYIWIQSPFQKSFLEEIEF